MRRASLWLSALLLPSLARAASFDAEGRHHFDPASVVAESFEAKSPSGIGCENDCSFESVSGAELALDQERYLRVSSGQSPFELDFELPHRNESYVARLWVRHGRVHARLAFEHDDAARGTEAAWLFPSGRKTSDGWVELLTNPFSVTGRDLTRAFLRVEGTQVDIDALELVASGEEYHSGGACLGHGDPVCGPDAVCIGQRCRQGARFFPPLPRVEDRSATLHYLGSRLQHFFGGRFSRKYYLPLAQAELAELEHANDAFSFWFGFERAVHRLHDWHTGASSALDGQIGPKRLGLCFIEGAADLSQTTWPSQAGHADVLVSHVGPAGTLGLVPGDRLVAVDGQHPLVWAASLVSVNPSHHVATDPAIEAELAEALRDLIPRFATTFSVIRCSAAQSSCQPTVETLAVGDIESDVQAPACDNRPQYHLDNPPEQFPGMIATYHYVPFLPWREKVTESDANEKIFGMTFDTLFGGPGGLTQFFLDSNDFFRQNARGVILDHRAGNGGTLDAPEAITRLVRQSASFPVGPVFPVVAGDVGPSDPALAAAWVQKLIDLGASSYQVGSSDPDLALPVALLIHRDASASDWLPLGMKGAPNVRVFGPHPTAGAFSSFYSFSYWSRFDFQLASGDTYAHDGSALLGTGIAPDEVVAHSQSSLLAGKDAPFEAALAWVRSRLKP